MREPDRSQDRRHVHDRPAPGLQHRRDLPAHPMKDAVQVDVDHPPPGVRRIRARGQVWAADTGIVDSHVQAAAAGPGKINQRFHCVLVGDIGGAGPCRPARGGDRVDDRPACVVVKVADDDGCARCAQLLRDGAADAGPGTRDQCSLSREIEPNIGHVASPVAGCGVGVGRAPSGMRRDPHQQRPASMRSSGRSDDAWRRQRPGSGPRCGCRRLARSPQSGHER